MSIMHKNVKKTVFVGILSAMSFVLFLFPKFPLLAAFPWLDFDLSDIPALLASVTISPIAGLAVALIKNVLHLTVTSTATIGELSNFLINGTFVLVTGLVYKYVVKSDERVSYLLFSTVCGAVFQLVAAILVNYFLMIPMYSAFVNFEEIGGAQYYILAGVIPFNLIKNIVASVVFVAIFKLLNLKFLGFLNK